jgi:hypothetical protein
MKSKITKTVRYSVPVNSELEGNLKETAKLYGANVRHRSKDSELVTIKYGFFKSLDQVARFTSAVTQLLKLRNYSASDEFDGPARMDELLNEIILTTAKAGISIEKTHEDLVALFGEVKEKEQDAPPEAYITLGTTIGFMRMVAESLSKLNNICAEMLTGDPEQEDQIPDAQPN